MATDPVVVVSDDELARVEVGEQGSLGVVPMARPSPETDEGEEIEVEGRATGEKTIRVERPRLVFVELMEYIRVEGERADVSERAPDARALVKEGVARSVKKGREGSVSTGSIRRKGRSYRRDERKLTGTDA